MDRCQDSVLLQIALQDIVTCHGQMPRYSVLLQTALQDITTCYGWCTIWTNSDLPMKHEQDIVTCHNMYKVSWVVSNVLAVVACHRQLKNIYQLVTGTETDVQCAANCLKCMFRMLWLAIDRCSGCSNLPQTRCHNLSYRDVLDGATCCMQMNKTEWFATDIIMNNMLWHDTWYW